MSRPKHAAEPSATFGDVFAVREYRPLYIASLFSWAGDYLARAAVSGLVYHATGSAALSAGTFVVGYLPWLTLGPLLSALAERYAKRTVMVTCDVLRAAVIGVVAIPGMPIWALLALLFTAALLNPPFESARAALAPSILTGDRYVVALSIQNTTSNFAMIGGYFVGGLVGIRYPHLTLLADALTFAASAVLVRFGVRRRPLLPSAGTTLLRETGAGFRLVFSSQVLRSIVVIVLSASLLAIVPEGLAAAWAAHLARDASERGTDQALIMISVPAGSMLGAVFSARLLSDSSRRRLIQPFAVLLPVALTAALIDPPVLGVAAVGLVVGYAVSSIALPANGLYVKSLPTAFRARAFGVALSGIQLVQVIGLVVTGLLSDHFAIHEVVGIWGIIGIGLMIIAVGMWPRPEVIDAAIADAKAANEANDALAEAAAATAPPPRPARWPHPRLGGTGKTVAETPIGPLPDARG